MKTSERRSRAARVSSNGGKRASNDVGKTVVTMPAIGSEDDEGLWDESLQPCRCQRKEVGFDVKEPDVGNPQQTRTSFQHFGRTSRFHEMLCENPPCPPQCRHCTLFLSHSIPVLNALSSSCIFPVLLLQYSIPAMVWYSLEILPSRPCMVSRGATCRDIVNMSGNSKV